MRRRELIAGLASTVLAAPAFGRFARTGGVAGLSQSTKTIGSAGGRDYATPELWIAGLPSVIPYPQQQVGLMYNDSLFTSTGISIAGIDTSSWTGSGQPAIILTTGPGQSFRDNANVRANALTYNPANGVAISINATANGRAVSVSIQNVAFRNIQVQCNNGNRVFNTDLAGGATVGATGIYLDNMIINGNTASNWVCAAGSVATNCLFEQSANIPTVNGSGTIFDGAVSLCGATFRFCTLVQYSDTSPTDQTLWNTLGEGGHATVIANTGLFGATTITNPGTASGNFAVTIPNPCFSDAPGPFVGTFPAGLTIVPYAGQFFGTTSTTRDWRLPDGSALRATGTPIAGVTTDITGFPRNATTPCVGCWEHA